jgi:large subunit ribosomal protein L13
MITKLSRTFFADHHSVKRGWVLVDADGCVLGRLAAQIAKILRGKHRPYYTPHVNCGDNVVIINSSKIKLTGKKAQSKCYYRHTGFPGGIKKTKAFELLSSSYPEKLFKLAVKRMLPKESPLARQQFKCLHVYSESDHPHKAQNPVLITPMK